MPEVLIKILSPAPFSTTFKSPVTIETSAFFAFWETELIISYKRKENNKLQQKINEENASNEAFMNEIKEYRKKLIE